MTKFVFTTNYEKALTRIEEYIFNETDSLKSVESFLDEHDKALMFLSENPKTPAVHPVTGDQSWNFNEGRYRLFFRCIEKGNELTIYLIHLIDNKEVNSEIYPENKIPTYDDE